MPERADIERVLGHYGINGRVVGERRGPLLQLTEFEPAAGTKIKKLASALDDIARELKVSSVNVEPVPGSNSVWLEIPAETPAKRPEERRKRKNTPLRSIPREERRCKALPYKRAPR